MSDREQLAARLVRTTAEAIYGGPAFGEATKRKARRATVATLREVIRDIGAHDLIADDVRLYAEELADLADYIEKGAGER